MISFCHMKNRDSEKLLITDHICFGFSFFTWLYYMRDFIISPWGFKFGFVKCLVVQYGANRSVIHKSAISLVSFIITIFVVVVIWVGYTLRLYYFFFSSFYCANNVDSKLRMKYIFLFLSVCFELFFFAIGFWFKRREKKKLFSSFMRLLCFTCIQWARQKTGTHTTTTVLL